MAYDLEEQEQLDTVKAWWKSYGNTVLIAIAVAAAGFSGMQSWQYYQSKQAIQASAQYDVLTQTDPKDLKSIKAISAVLMDKFSSTPYAGRAAVMVAKANYAANDAKSAKAQLQWAIDHAKEDAIESIAHLQLAAILLGEKDYAHALEALAAKHESSFDGLFADLKGDILVAQGKHDEAKLAYQDALMKLDQRGSYYHYTEHKLEALGV